ncbi:retrovirus-related Pol polyprotein from transposon 297 [Trichonephila clavipes]|nr:retrovirus-related Pol polyprotein from transposon 297 [Trichonephila clavipes]
MENVTEFLENIDNNLTYYEIPTQLTCAYLKGQLTGRALDWFEVLGFRVVEDKVTDYAHLKQALTDQFPVVRNRSELETCFYASSQKHNQKPSDFVYDLLKIHKILKLEMTEEKLLDHVISRLTPQILDYVEVRHPQTTFNLQQIIDKYEERFLNRKIRGSSREFRDTNQSENNRFPNRKRQENWRETRGNNRYSDNSKPQRQFNRFKGQGVSDNRRFDGRRRGGQSDHRFHNQGGRQVGSRNGAFRGVDFMKESKLTLDFDQKSLIITDDQIKQLPKVEKPVEINLSDTKLDSPEAYRFAIYYRKINAITKYPRYPLPVIDVLITNIPHTGIMSTLDLKSGYFQLSISPKDIEKAAFITRNGTFAFLRMPFDLSEAALNFQEAIDVILKPVIWRFVMVYMDDVFITSPSFNEHIDNLNQLFTLLRDAGLTLNKDKCHFARDKLKYLGLIFSKEGIETDNSKVKAIAEMKPPKNNREMSKFLRMAEWYQKFIPHYADICEPLYWLKKKRDKFNWSTEAQDAVNKVKRALTEAPVLQLPNFQEQFNLFTDASGVGMGAVLNQNHRPIAFASRTLNKAKRNYTVTERECLAVIWALNKFKTYFGSLPVKVITDHAALR